MLKSLMTFCAFVWIPVQADAQILMPEDSIGTYYRKADLLNHAVSHDPSIVLFGTGEEKEYYIFGTHRTGFKSNDLVNWSDAGWHFSVPDGKGGARITDDEEAFYENQTKQVPAYVNGEVSLVKFGNFNGTKWRDTDLTLSGPSWLWAPDVIWNKYLNRWCMYLSLAGERGRSVIVLLTSDEISGPYTYQGPVVFSGIQFDFNGLSWKNTDLTLVPGLQGISELPSRYGTGNSWYVSWPNCIDPCVFFDGDDMWMSYGSWAGGIFLLKLDKNTGLRDYTAKYQNQSSGRNYSSDQYYGIKIAGGQTSSGEGSYIKKIGKYYYLFISNGNIVYNAGYDMRVFRSSELTGPYKDALGNSAIFNTYQLNYGKDATSTAGCRLMGGYVWDSMEDVEIAQGHNSVLVDDDGKYYVIYHTRFIEKGNNFQDRIHQLFANIGGWLVASPYEYTGCQYNQDSIETRRLCSESDIVGSYKIIVHEHYLDYSVPEYEKPADIMLQSDGTVSGDYTGTWTCPKEGTSFIRLKLKSSKGVEQVTYNGVVLPQTVSGTNMPAICISAVSTTGIPLWCSKVDGRYAIDCSTLNYKSPVVANQIVMRDFDLETVQEAYGTTISWMSSRPDIINNEGKLQVETDKSQPPITLILTCRFQKDNYYYEKEYPVKIYCSDPTNVVSVDISGANRDDYTGLYNINGHKVDGSYKGIGIKEGKKILLK